MLILLFLGVFPLVVLATNSCDPDRLARLTLLWEACRSNIDNCDILLAAYENEKHTITSITDNTVLPVNIQNGRDHGVVEPGQYVQTRKTDGSQSFSRSYGTFRYYDSGRSYRNSTILEYRISRSIDGEISLTPTDQIVSEQAISEQNIAKLQLQEIFNAAEIDKGYEIIIEGQKFIVSEIQGEIIDRAGEYIFLKRGKEVVRYPVTKFIQTAAAHFSPRAIASARTIVQMGGRISSALLRSPIVAALELALSPTEVGCAELSSQFIRNVCSKDPSQFTSWFLQLSLYDRKEILKDPHYCELLNSILKKDIDRVKDEKNQRLERYKSLWKPQSIQCDGKKVSFEMDRNTLGTIPSTDGQRFRYVFEENCHQQRAANCSNFLLSVGQFAPGSDNIMGPIQQYEFSDNGGHIVSAGGVVQPLPEQMRRTSVTSGGNRDLHLWLFDHVNRHCWNQLMGRDPSLQVDPEMPHRTTQ